MRATRMSAVGLVAVMACGFDPSAGSGPGGGAAGGPDGGSGSGSIGGQTDAATGGDAATPVAQLVTPYGPPTTIGDLGGDGGSEFTGDCPAEHIVTGLDAEDNDFGLCRLRAVCSRLVVRDGVVEVLDPATTQTFGNENSYYDIDPVDCPVGSVLVAFEGSESRDGLVEHLRLSCAPIQWDGSNVSLGAAAEVSADLGSPSGGSSGAGACPAGQLAAGIAGRAGTIVDRFQLRCYQLTATPE